MRIKTKEEFLRLYRLGRLGNYLQIWDSVSDLERSGYTGDVTLRARVKDSPRLIVSVPASQAVSALRCSGLGEGEYYVQEVPRSERRLNFEAMRCPHFLVLRYGTHPSLSLREDLTRNGREVLGARAYFRLKFFLGEEMAQLDEIWDQFPDAVIEATLFKDGCGVWNRPLVIWEVRDY